MDSHQIHDDFSEEILKTQTSLYKLFREIPHNKKHTISRAIPIITALVNFLIRMIIQPDLIYYNQAAVMLVYKILCRSVDTLQNLRISIEKHEYEFIKQQKALNQTLGIILNSNLPMITQSPNVQSRYSEDFNELSFIAKGGFGNVYKVENNLDGMQYAIKKVRIRPEKSILDELSEVRTFASLSHPNIVSYKTAWTEEWTDKPQNGDNEDEEETGDTNPTSHENGESMASRECQALCKIEYNSQSSLNIRTTMLYIQMSLCDGPLESWLADRNSKTDSNWFITHNMEAEINIFSQIMRGLNHIHIRDIIHHDLKPGNILMKNGRPQIGDFGLACIDRRPHGPRLGTPFYAAPEQIKGICDRKNDLYSVGIIFLELMYPFQTAMEKDRTLRSIQEGSIPREILVRPIVAEIIQGLTASDLDKK